jgi:hypothetical protein
LPRKFWRRISVNPWWAKTVPEPVARSARVLSRPRRLTVASFDCALHSVHEAGSHTVFFGRVLNIVEADDPTLIYGQRSYARVVMNGS